MRPEIRSGAVRSFTATPIAIGPISVACEAPRDPGVDVDLGTVIAKPERSIPVPAEPRSGARSRCPLRSLSLIQVYYKYN